MVQLNIKNLGNKKYYYDEETDSWRLYIENQNFWNGKKLLINGDSIADGYQDSINGGPTVPFVELTANDLNMSYTNYSTGGSTIAVRESVPDNRDPIVTRYQDMSNEGDIIIIAGGTNDWQYSWTPLGDIDSRDICTFYGALHTLCLGLIDKYTSKQILFSLPIKRVHGSEIPFYQTNDNGKTLRDYCDIIKEVCRYYSIPIIDMFSESGINPHIESEKDLYIPDGSHPNEEGHIIMARRLTGFLKQLA